MGEVKNKDMRKTNTTKRKQKRFKQVRRRSDMNYNEWRKYNNIKIPKWVKVEVRKRDIDTCQYCGKICVAKKVEQGVTPTEEFLYDMLTFDHILPRSLGGSNSPENICVACYECNWRKGAQVEEIR